MTTTTQTDSQAQFDAARQEVEALLKRNNQNARECEELHARLGQYPLGDPAAGSIEKKIAALRAESPRIDARLAYLREHVIPAAEAPLLEQRLSDSLAQHDAAVQRHNALAERIRTLQQQLDEAALDYDRVGVEIDTFRNRNRNLAAEIGRHRDAYPHIYSEESKHE